MIRMTLPESGKLFVLTHAVFDLNGTLACDGELLPGVAERVAALRRHLECRVVSADTHHTLDQMAQRLGIAARVVRTGEEKAQIVNELGRAGVVAIGNGRNDEPMFRQAALRLAVLGPEGLYPNLLLTADVVVPSAIAAVDLLLHPSRLIATLRP